LFGAFFHELVSQRLMFIKVAAGVEDQSCVHRVGSMARFF
jgi:hypothetical protein